LSVDKFHSECFSRCKREWKGICVSECDWLRKSGFIDKTVFRSGVLDLEFEEVRLHEIYRRSYDKFLVGL
jgi:hypothetical protein